MSHTKLALLNIRLSESSHLPIRPKCKTITTSTHPLGNGAASMKANIRLGIGLSFWLQNESMHP